MSIVSQSRSVITVVWLLVTIISVTYIWHNVSVVSDMQQFMPSDSQDKRLQVLLHETTNGLTTNLILAQLKGTEPEYLAKLSQNLKNTLQNQVDIFESVANGSHNWDPEPYGSLIEYRYLLKHPDNFSVIGLRKTFEELLAAVRSGASAKVIEYMLLDPQYSFIQYLFQQSGHPQPEKFNGVWFVNDKSKALLMMQLRSSGFNLDRQQTAINLIKNTVKKLDPDSRAELILSGPGMIAVATRDAIRSTTQQVSWILSIVVVFIFWFGYRSIRLAFMASLPLVISMIMAIAITQVIFGELHGIVLAFGITLLGVCLDYPLHLFSHLVKNESATTTLKRIWPTLQLGALTSVLAYVALIGTGFSGLTQLAVFSATGLIVALAVTRWLLPVWVSEKWIHKRTVPVSYPISSRAKVSISVVVIGLPLFILLIQDNIWSHDITQISPVSSSARKIDKQLRQSLHAPEVSHVFLIEAETMNEVMAKTENVKSLIKPTIEEGIISGVLSATDILPDKSRQKYYQSLLPDKKTLQHNVAEALEDLAFKKNIFDNFINTVSESKIRTPVNYQDIVSTPLGGKLKSMLFEQDAKWYSLIRVIGIADEKVFNRWLKVTPEISEYYISMRASTNTLMNNYRQVAGLRLLGVLGLVVLAILWQTRKRKETFWLLVPVVAGVLVSLAVQVILGHMINIFHLLSLLLVIGMGLDYSLFFNRNWTNRTQLQERTHAIVISAVTTIVVFTALALSNIPILAAMGQTVAVGIMTCFIVAQRVAVPFAISKEQSG